MDVTNLDERTWLDHAGNFHSDALHVVERYTPIDASHIMYEATLEDPKVFSRPWKISMPLYRRIDKNVKILEYECVYYLQDKRYGNAKPVKMPAMKAMLSRVSAATAVLAFVVTAGPLNGQRGGGETSLRARRTIILICKAPGRVVASAFKKPMLRARRSAISGAPVNPIPRCSTPVSSRRKIAPSSRGARRA